MPTRPASRLLVRAAAIALIAAPAFPALAQKQPVVPKPADAQKQPADVQKKPVEKKAAESPKQPVDLQKQRVAWIKDWIHYTRIHRFDQAQSNAKALLDSGITDTELVSLIDDTAKVESDFNDVVLRSQRHAEVEAIAARLQKSYEQGKLAHAREASEIARNISLLTGTQRERIFGRDRLKFAGEYAAPQLLSALLDRANIELQAQVRSVLVEMSRQAIVPLVTALPGLDPSSQEVVVGLLGDIPYPTSVPFLYELRAQTKSAAVRGACERSILKVAGAVNDQIPLAERFLTLANEYYQESRSLTSFPDESVQLLWSFDPGVGLIPVAIDTSVYHEAMSMRLCERTLRHDPQSGQALSLWIAANFSREIDSPAGYDNPAYGKDRRDATYYAVAAGAAADQRVLARAIDDRDTQLARKAIAAIEKTAGGNALWAGDESRKPLLEAITYPNRRVQYEAALALGAAQPRTEFPGSERVVPVLGSAIRNAAARYALVVATTQELGNGPAQILRAKGYTILPPAKQLSEVEQAIAECPGLDLIVTNLPAAQTDALIAEVRGRHTLGATPVLALVSVAAYSELGAKYQTDQATRVAREGLSGDEVGAAADQLINAAVGGPVSAEEATQYKSKSLFVLRDLAVSGSTVLNVGDAAGPLVAALAENTGPLKLLIAEVLSYIPAKSVQIALMDAAMAATGNEQIVLLNKVADSAKRNGNMLDGRQISALVQLATGGGSDEHATAAAACMGALNLPNAELIPLIIGKNK